MERGDEAPEFELPDETGAPRRLSDLLREGPVVLFFYPGAMTPLCTAESCHFRDLSGEFASVGAQPVGISADGIDKQNQFANKHGFGFPLLSDPDGIVAHAFGVKRSFAGLPNKRATFVVGADRRILAVIKSEVRAKVHADRALEALRAAPTG